MLSILLLDVCFSSPAAPAAPRPPGGLHLDDVEGMIRYSLQQEVATHSVITGDALLALKDYISIMAKVLKFCCPILC